MYMLLALGWLYKLWCTTKMEYHTSIKYNKEVLYVSEGINLQDILLGEKSKIQTTVTCVL